MLPTIIHRQAAAFPMSTERCEINAASIGSGVYIALPRLTPADKLLRWCRDLVPHIHPF